MQWLTPITSSPGGRDQKDHGLRPALEKVCKTSTNKKLGMVALICHLSYKVGGLDPVHKC
jgi:hypothetical protein